jgi:hypothetical protein
MDGMSNSRHGPLERRVRIEEILIRFLFENGQREIEGALPAYYCQPTNGAGRKAFQYTGNLTRRLEMR